MVVRTVSLLEGLDWSDDEVDRMFRALADRTRRDILRRTLTQDASVSDLAGHYDMSFAAVQKHVAVLEGAGLVHKHTRGRERHVRADAEALHRAQLLLDRLEMVWRARVDRLEALLTEGPPTSDAAINNP